MFTDQSRSVKFTIIALHNSPGIPWHIVLVCSVQALQLRQILLKNKSSQCSFLQVVSDIFVFMSVKNKWLQNSNIFVVNAAGWWHENMHKKSLRECRHLWPSCHWETSLSLSCRVCWTPPVSTAWHALRYTGKKNPKTDPLYIHSICSGLKMAAISKTNMCVRTQCVLIIAGSSVCRHTLCLYKMTCREELCVWCEVRQHL